MTTRRKGFVYLECYEVDGINWDGQASNTDYRKQSSKVDLDDIFQIIELLPGDVILSREDAESIKYALKEVSKNCHNVGWSDCEDALLILEAAMKGDE